MARYDDLDTTVIGYATFISCVLLMVIILLARALCYSYIEDEDSRKLLDGHYVSADETISAQKARVASYERVKVEVAPPASDSPDGGNKAVEPTEEERLHIPVQRARDILLNELSSAEGSST